MVIINAKSLAGENNIRFEINGSFIAVAKSTEIPNKTYNRGSCEVSKTYKVRISDLLNG